MEIMKQLYDVAGLADVTDDINTVTETFKSFAKTELIKKE
jgi:hypothetical protein